MPRERLEVLPQVAQPINRLSGKFSFTQRASIVGVVGVIVFGLIGMSSPSLLTLSAALVGYFAAVASAGFFKSYEREAELVDHRRRLVGPLESQAKSLTEYNLSNTPNEFAKRFESFKRVQDSEHFAFLSDNLQGIYLDCIDMADLHLAALRNQVTITTLENDFGIKHDSNDAKEITRVQLIRMTTLLLDHCRIDAKLPRPRRTLQIQKVRTKKLGPLVLYRITEDLERAPRDAG
jgi:hypothetical protein